MTEVFCNFALRNTKNQNRINGSGFVSLIWLTLADALRTACLDFDKSNLNEIKAILATTA